MPLFTLADVVSLNHDQGEVYNIMVIKFVSDLWQAGGFLWVLRLPPSIKLTATSYNWNIVESGIKHHQTNKQTNTKVPMKQMIWNLYTKSLGR